jgi:hypothetical protein
MEMSSLEAALEYAGKLISDNCAKVKDPRGSAMLVERNASAAEFGLMDTRRVA